MALTSEDIESIAHLARLGVDQEALAPLATDLSTVLELVEQLQAIDTTGVEPMAHPVNAQLVLRDDKVLVHESREALQQAAPSVRDGYFLVPRVIE